MKGILKQIEEVDIEILNQLGGSDKTTTFDLIRITAGLLNIIKRMVEKHGNNEAWIKEEN